MKDALLGLGIVILAFGVGGVIFMLWIIDLSGEPGSPSYDEAIEKIKIAAGMVAVGVCLIAGFFFL